MTRAVIVTGLAYGDEGKGGLVSYLSRTLGATLVVRHNGGAQAAHNVVTDRRTYDGSLIEHAFSSFGSGTFHNVPTHLGPQVYVNPVLLLKERDALIRKGVHGGLLSALTIDPEALVTTPWHVCVNRMLEVSRGDSKHGSCGLGIGETRYIGDLHPTNAMRVQHLMNRTKLQEMRDIIYERALASNEIDFGLERVKMFVKKFSDPELFDGFFEQCKELDQSCNLSEYHELPDGLTSVVIFEGAQGLLLDETYGEQPHTTWSNTTSGNAMAMLLRRGQTDKVLKLGVIRSYLTRHGAGPLPHEIHDGEWLSDLKDSYKEHNQGNEWMGHFRYAPMTFQALDKSASIETQDAVALTHTDPAFCDTYDKHVIAGWGFHPRNFEVFEEGLRARIIYTSHGPADCDKSPRYREERLWQNVA